MSNKQTDQDAPRIQKIFRLPCSLVDQLKREACERSMAGARVRVTETEIVEQALRQYFLTLPK